MLLRRCAVLYCEPREALALDLQALLTGNGALGAELRWIALAPHIGIELELDAAELAALGAIGPSLWLERADCERRHGAAAIAALLRRGLLLADGAADEEDQEDGAGHVNKAGGPHQADEAGEGQHAGHAMPLAHWRARDEALRAAHWRGLSATAHIFSRWHDVQGDKGKRFPTFNDLVQRFGPPPPASVEHGPADAAIALPAPAAGPLDATLLRRYTGRHYDAAATLPLAVAARLLQRTFGAQQTRTMMPGADALKKTSPSGGGLHPVEAYVLAQRVADVAPGLYHYHSQRHVLEPMRLLPADQLKALALAAVADQDWFADAPLLVVLVARVQRTFWKYRDHAKAYRVLQLDAGHLSQTFYLLATEAGLPAFVTAGMNEVNLEQAFGFDPLQQAVLAISGCGAAAEGVSPVTEFR